MTARFNEIHIMEQLSAEAPMDSGPTSPSFINTALPYASSAVTNNTISFGSSGVSFAGPSFAHTAVSFSTPAITSTTISTGAPLFTQGDAQFDNILFARNDAPLLSQVDIGIPPPISSPIFSNLGFGNENTSLVLMQYNGRKILTPPSDWVGPPPSSACELYVRRIPRTLELEKFMVPFLRFGRVYEIRLPMDYQQANRGYAYVKYTNEEDAACAMMVLSHFYILPCKRLEIMRSYEKSRLFINNIPRHLTEGEIEAEMRTIFPSMQRIFMRSSCVVEQENSGSNANSAVQVDHGAGGDNCNTPMMGQQHVYNRGHVFIQFASHMHALEAKRSTTPGLIHLWGRDLKVVWANNIRHVNISKETKTLFVRNVDMMVNNSEIIDMLMKYVPRSAIRKISKVRAAAFFEFVTREAAETCLVKVQGEVLCGQVLDVEWAKPSEHESLHRMRNIDYDALLRIKCIANGWQIPVILFSTFIDIDSVQYCAVMMRNESGAIRGIFCVMHTYELVDLHSRLCEVVCLLIETIGSFPDYNYVFFVSKDTAHLIGMIVYSLTSMKFIASCGVPAEFRIDLNELMDMGWAIVLLSTISEGTLLNAYKKSFYANTTCTYLKNWAFFGRRIFGTIMPKYRNKCPLAYNLNDTQIVLALCSAFTGTNGAQPNYPYMPFSVASLDVGYEALRYVALAMMPMALAQSRFTGDYVLNCVKFGDMQYYHPAQRINMPPLWISGYSYGESIKQLQQSDEEN